MDSIPRALRPLVKRLESVPDLSREDRISILFVVRLADNLHRSFYATFLTLSLVEQLCDKLGISDLTLEDAVFATRWSFRQGTVTAVHRLGFDYDMESVSVLTKIASAVLAGTMTPKEGLKCIRDHEMVIEKRTQGSERRPETLYRDFPGRTLVIPLMSATCAVTYFQGTWLDLGFAAVCGLTGGIIAWACSLNQQAMSVMDYVVAIFTAMIALGSVQAFPDATCFSAQVLGTLYWFLYGTAYVMAIYEITNNQVVTGLTRFASAVLRSYGLAVGVVLGTWFAGYASDRWSVISDDCTVKSGQISDLWFILFFPLSAVACLMQFRVKLRHFLLCLIVQTAAYGSQYLIGTVWNQPEFIANLVPAYLATLASSVCVSAAHRLKLSSLSIDRQAYVSKKNDEEGATEQGHSSESDRDGCLHDSDRVHYVDSGWAVKEPSGYRQVDKLTYAQSDIWFCLLPALYLLVPGSKLLQTAFTQLLASFDGSSDSVELDALASSLLIIALGQVVGLRLGFTTLSAFSWVLARIRM